MKMTDFEKAHIELLTGVSYEEAKRLMLAKDEDMGVHEVEDEGKPLVFWLNKATGEVLNDELT